MPIKPWPEPPPSPVGAVVRDRELSETRLRCQRELLVTRLEHAEEPAHLLERLVTAALDHAECLTRLARLGIEYPSSPSRPENHHAEARVTMIDPPTDTAEKLTGKPPRRSAEFARDHARSFAAAEAAAPQ
jgi:hypothetical protein